MKACRCWTLSAALTAIRSGRWILSLAESPVWEGFGIGILVITIGGTRTASLGQTASLETALRL